MLYNSVYLWLTSPDDYPAGLALLRETGYSGYTLTILAKGEDAYNRSRLESELQKWLSGQKNVLPTDPVESSFSEQNSVRTVERSVTVALDYGASVTPIVIPAKTQTPATEPMDVQTIRERTYALLDSRAEAKAALRAMESLGNDETACAKRLPYAVSVKETTRQLDELYSQLEFFDQYGYLPPLATDPALVLDDRTALLNARSYVSRYKGKLKKKNLTPDQQKAYQTLLNQYTQEKDRLEAKLRQPLPALPV